MKRLLQLLSLREWNVEKAAQRQVVINERRAVWVAVLARYQEAAR